MTLKDLNNRNICILGYGREGRASLRALQTHVPSAHITIADANAAAGEPGFELITGPHYLDTLDQFDVIIKAPGIPLHNPALEGKLTSGTELFLSSLPKDINVIGITGTKGKSSTATLIAHILKTAGQPVILAGNIGQPVLELLSEAKPGLTFVLELSSYQLETLRTSPHLAVITSLFPDHLDYHGTFEAYKAAKRHIVAYQQPSDVVFYNGDSPDCIDLAQSSPGRHVAFHAQDYPWPVTNHAYNPGNLAAALAVGREVGIADDIIHKALDRAPSLPHRLQPLGVHAGIDWVDDSAATTPQSTLNALGVLGERVDTLIAGGLDRSYDYTELGTAIAASHIRNIILFPETGAKIRAAIGAHSRIAFYETSDMTEAVSLAVQHTTPGTICLLSSGAPSYNLYKDFNDRGEAFIQAVAAFKVPGLN